MEKCNVCESENIIWMPFCGLNETPKGVLFRCILCQREWVIFENTTEPVLVKHGYGKEGILR